MASRFVYSMNQEKQYSPESDIPSEERTPLMNKLLIFGGGIMLGMTILASMGVMKERFLGPDEYITGNVEQNLVLLEKNISVMDFSLMFVKHESGQLPPATEARNVMDAFQAHGYDIEVQGLFFPRQAVDPFSPEQTPLRYSVLNTEEFVLLSNGPDGDEDLDERTLSADKIPDSSGFYHPSNGLESNGDILYIRRGEQTIEPTWKPLLLAE